ncbi:pulcherriminic acid synthase [Allokutzneria albata]|uniref:Pulcherriminic acid synthase n=1 Tax=Allokutzneria albata TaxID=211114 RepID=A0A1G9SP05_ALLAB|nr:pulcherriminic acid synthase [Allokutzneria albata]
MPEFRIPTLDLPFAARPRRADAAELASETCDWGERHRVIGPRGRARLLGSTLLDLGIDLTGATERERAAVLMCWFLWMLGLDDRIDNGTWALEGDLDEFCRTVTEVVTGAVADLAPDADPMLRALHQDLWPRTAELAGPDWRDRFARHLAAHLRAQRLTVEHRDADRLPALAHYLELRRDLFGADVFFDLIEVLDGPVAVTDRFDEVRRCAADVIAWTNDVYSLEKDLAFGEPANLVVLLRAEDNSSWQLAVDTAHTLIQKRAEDFRLAEADAPHGPLPGLLEHAMRVSQDWHRESSRYRLSGEPGRESVRTELTPPSLLWPRLERDPHRYFALLREEFPVVWDEPLDAWLVSRYEDVRFALTAPGFTSRNYSWQLAPMYGETVLQLDGREHAAHRSVVSPAFRGQALEALREVVTTTARDLVGRLRGRERFDLVAEFCHELPVTVVVTALGLPREDTPLFQRWYRDGFSYLGNYRQDPERLERGMVSRDELYDYLTPHLERRRARPGADLLSTLCAAEVDGRPLDDEMIKGFCGTLLGAGGETTDKALSSFLANLLDHPDQLAEVRDDPGLIPQAWAESLRRNPPVLVVLRQTDRAVALGGRTIPAGATVACLVGAANRDPRRFGDPDRFDIHRVRGPVDREFTAAASHLAFGAGRHFCLGALVARMETEIGVRELLTALPGLRWAEGFAPVETGLLTRAPKEIWASA